MTHPSRPTKDPGSADPGWVAPYDFGSIDLESGSTHADVVNLVGEGRRVLELGPATGYMSRVLSERGCDVVAIEQDPRMAERAAEYVERIIVGDIEELDLPRALGNDRFDAIVAADVLEHLRNPVDTLKRLTGFLAEEGFVVLSIPNVAHSSVRLALLGGEFCYQDRGLLDRTHVRFFTRRSIEEMLDETELGVAVLNRHELDLHASEVAFDETVASNELKQQLDSDPDARTYQFVIKALPMARDGLRELQRQMRAAALKQSDTERERDQLRSSVVVLQDQIGGLTQIASREAEVRRLLVDAHDQLMVRDAELARLAAELEGLRREHVRLEELRNGDRAWSEEQAVALARQGEELQALRASRALEGRFGRRVVAGVWRRLGSLLTLGSRSKR